MLEPDLDSEASLKVINKTVDRTGVQERTGDVALMHSPAKLRHDWSIPLPCVLKSLINRLFWWLPFH